MVISTRLTEKLQKRRGRIPSQNVVWRSVVRHDEGTDYDGDKAILVTKATQIRRAADLPLELFLIIYFYSIYSALGTLDSPKF
jgi:hypothetical protein